VTDERSLSSRRAVVRRHRRERQVFVFGLLFVGIAAVAAIAMGVYRGDIQGPFAASFVTPAPTFSATTSIVCPPGGSLPLPADQVAVRVLNGTRTQGLAAQTTADLKGRGFVTLGAANWTRSYDGTARIMFGRAGVQKAYTLALQFPTAELVLDTRDNATVDVVLGAKFTELRPLLSPELNPNTPLAANAPCLPASLVDAEPAPHIYPKDPLAPVTTPSPSTSATP
jgi:hypothetical protein